MKKKNDDKKQKVLKIIKIICCSLGLLLCGGAFIGLLFVGVRGCASQSNKKVVSETTLKQENNLMPRKINTQEELQEVTINNVNYYPFVFLTPQFDSNISISSVPVNAYEQTYHVKTLINDVERNFYTLYVTKLTNGYYLQEYSFYNVPSATKTDILGFSFSSGAPSGIQTSSNFHVGDIVYFESEGFKQFYKNITFAGLNNPFGGGAFSPYLNKKITFNNQINRYSLLNQDNSVLAQGNITGDNVFLNGLFRDGNGQLYRNMRVNYADGNDSTYTTDGKTTHLYEGGNSVLMYIYIQYERIDNISNNGNVTGTYILANTCNYVTVGDNYPVYTNESRWLSSFFQDITIITLNNKYVYSNLPSANQDRINVLSGLNNLSNISGVGGTYGGNIGGTNPFILIGNAFSSLLPILNTTIIPGLTIGTLLLIPLVGSIVLFVVFLFKR